MPWWEYESDKKYPWVPLDPGPQPGDFRIPASIFCLLAAAVLMICAIVALFIGAVAVAGWGVGLSIVLTVLSRLLMPSSGSRR
jgi:hypothetical protein